MDGRWNNALCFWTVAIGIWTGIPDPALADDFGRNVAPVLNKNCVACHNSKAAEGGLNLESFERLAAGGDSGPSFIAGDPDGSELLARIRATDDSVMPPADNSVGAERLSETEIAHLENWIREGAQPPIAENRPTIQWRNISEAVHPIYALQASRDGHYLSFAKGNIAYLVEAPFADGEWAPTPLLDPSLTLGDGTPIAATDKDLIHSIAFSRNSQMVAIGGYRTVKLWQRQTSARMVEPTASSDVRLLTSGGAIDWSIVQDQDRTLSVFPNADKNNKQVIGQVDKTILSAAWAKERSALWVLNEANQLSRWRPDSTDLQAAWIVDEPVFAEALPELLVVAVTESQQVLVVTKLGQVLKLVEDAGTWRYELAFSTEQPIKIAKISPNAKMLLAIDSQNSATLWRLDDGAKIHVLGADYETWQSQQQTQRQMTRLESWIKRLTETLPALEETIKKEEEARGKVAETHQKAIEAQQAKEQEIATAQQAVREAETSIAAVEQQLAAAKQLLLDRQKAVTDLQPGLVAAQQNLAKAMQALASSDTGLQLARDKVPAQQARIENHRQELQQQQQLLEQTTKATRGATLAAAFDAKSDRVLLLTASGHGLVYASGTAHPLAVLQPPTDWSDPGTAATGTNVDLFVSVEQMASIRTEQRTWQWNLNLPWELVKIWGSDAEEQFSSRVTALAFSPDDRYLAIGGGPPSRFGDLKELNVATGQVQRDYGQVHSDTILAIEYSPDGKWLATAGADKLCRLHDPMTGAVVKILEGHTHFVQSLSWQDQAQILATGSADKTVKTWDVETGERRQSITGFGKEISAIAYVGDSEQLVSVSLDGSTRLHRGDNAQLVRNYAQNPQPLYTLSLSPDGTKVLVGDHDGKIRIYQVEDAQLLRQWPQP